MFSINRVLLIILISINLWSCGSDNTNASSETPNPTQPDPEQNSSWYKPPTGTSWQWQLSGELNTDYDVEVYDVDLFDTSIETITSMHESGKKVICYFSAGSYESWRDDADLFEEAELGDTLDGWEDERWLDVRSQNVLALMTSRIALAKEKQCDAVEPDNVDGYANNSGFNLTYEDQRKFNLALAEAAHEQSLAIGLKNDLEQVIDLVESFDFAVNEQCFEYNECEYLLPFIESDKAVFNAEYLTLWQNDQAAREALCEDARSLQINTLVLPLNLDDSFRYSCNK